MSKSLIPIMTFISGASMMSLELVSSRLLSPFFGSSIYVWGSIITVFMISLAIGYLLGGNWSMKSPTLSRFRNLFLVAGILTIIVAPVSETILSTIFDLINDPRYGSLLASIILFSPATIIIGMISPYAVRLSSSEKEKVGLTAGQLYFTATLGSALGTLTTSFYLVLWFEVQTIVYISGVLLLIMYFLSATKPYKTHAITT